MLKYNEIIDINRDYTPYYDLLNEGDQAWKRFIITKQFYPLLDKTLDCLEKESLSLWLQGTYGTGKSHATGYLKHLLWLPLEEIKSHIDKFNDAQVKHRFLEYRRKSRVFPVVMYGADKITNQIDFGLQLEVGVRKAMKKYGLDLSLCTDFETYANSIEQDDSNYWDKLIENEYELGELVRSKKQMVNKLRAYDQDLFVAIRDVLNKQRRPIAVQDIVSWLHDVCAKLREESIADSIVIYWDEFTTILDKRNSEIHEYIQRIAEASHSSGVFLYLISHRTASQGSSRDDRNKLLGRFNDVEYEMSSITTYHLISNSIIKKDPAAWRKVAEKYAKDLDPVIEKILDNEDAIDPDNLRDIFPIHPYTANLATYIARVMGSTERSIFNFLYDDKNGFKFFIATYPGEKRVSVLTVDYVFDFFEKVFDEQDDPFMASVMQKLRYSESTLNKENPYYLPLLKTLLIMNIAHRKINLSTDHNDIVVPSEDNLYLATRASHLSSHIPAFLEFIEQKKILIPNHNERYIVEASSFDPSEVDSWIANNKKRHEDIKEILGPEYQKTLFAPLQNNHRRKDVTTCLLEDALCQDHLVRHKIEQKLKQDYQLNFMVFVGREESHLSDLKAKLNKLASESAPGICFVILDMTFSEAYIEKYLMYKAHNELASSKHEEEAAKAAKRNLQGLLKQWINEAVFNGFATWYILDKDGRLLSEKCSYPEMSRLIDGKIAPLVFHQSFDTMGRYASVSTAWDMKMAKKGAEVFFSSNTLSELTERCKGGPLKSAIEILYDKNGAYLVNEKLDIVNRPQEHPLILLLNKSDAIMSSDDEIELDTAFSVFFKPPFGFYKNHIFIAAMGFAMRSFKGKLYSPNTGEKLNEIAMIDLIETMFRYFNEPKDSLRNDLAIRVGSEKESRLVKVIEEIFGLNQCSSIVDTRYKVADWMKQNLRIPLWLIRYDADINDELKMAIQIIADDIMAIDSHIAGLNPGQYEEIAKELSLHKHALRRTFVEFDETRRLGLFKAFAVQNTEQDIRDLLGTKHEDLVEYLKQYMQGDPVYWNEETMKSVFKDWLISQLSPPPPTPPYSDDDLDSKTTKGENQIEPGEEDDALKLIQQNKDKVWGIVQKLIKEDKDIRYLIYKRLRELLR